MMLSTRNTIRKLNIVHRSHFSSSIIPKKKTSLEKQKILSKTLYKQILKWSAAIGYDVPFDPIPPLTLVPPRVDAKALEVIAKIHSSQGMGVVQELTPEEKHLFALTKLLPNAIIEPSQLIIPIENANHVKNATRLAYALNNFTEEGKDEDTDNDNDDVKDRVTLGFEVLKSLNQLSVMLEQRKTVREAHRDRSGVTFHVGQGKCQQQHQQ